MSAPELTMAATGSCQASLHQLEGWLLHEYAEVASTNLVAASLPPWSAVRAHRQTAGRGRFSRTWISDEGGLWLSAVVPVGPHLPKSMLPLAAGLAVCRCLSRLGVAGLRMRWPNDVLTGERKLAGLLIDQFAPDRFVVGIGLNVSNSPESLDPALQGRAARVQEFVAHPPALNDLAASLLSELRSVMELAERPHSSHLLSAINALWQGPRPVALDLDGPVRQGTFKGVNQFGQLALVDGFGQTQFFDPHQVRHLTEI